MKRAIVQAIVQFTVQLILWTVAVGIVFTLIKAVG